MRLLLVGDRQDIADALMAELRRHDFLVDHAGSIELAEEATALVSYGAVIVARQVGAVDGLSLIGLLRRRGLTMPVMVLSGEAEAASRIEGLNAGADDYLSWPFAYDELAARVRVLLRRSLQINAEVISTGNVTFNLTVGTVGVGENFAALTRRELLALECLMKSAGRIVRREYLFEQVYGSSDAIASNSLDSHISRLRRKLTALGADIIILPARGVGYVLRVDDERLADSA